MQTPHYDKIQAALANPKSKQDLKVLKQILEAYKEWNKKMNSLRSKGEDKVKEMVQLLNEYKNLVEVELIMKEGTEFLTRQKGQLKLDSSIMEEFLINLMNESIIPELKGVKYSTGPQQAFMSLSFQPQSFSQLEGKPVIVLKTKNQDFSIGKEIYYRFSADNSFLSRKTESGKLTLVIFAAECKINLDKTMFQEAAGTASRLKQGVPFSKYYVIVEYLDMTPEDCRLTDIDNVFLIRHAKRLPFEKRYILEEVRKQRKNCPIDYEVIWKFVNEIKEFLSAKWYDPEVVLKRGSFI